MKIIGLAPLFCSAALVASELPEIPALASYMLQGGAILVLAWIVYYLSRLHAASLESDRKDFLEFLRQEREANK